jgi:NAD(P)-dependent dehydrogenase (short-subunit alcohol dehydrogenase family)
MPGREADVQALIEHAQREHGGLDIFFANAGISGGFASIFEQTPEDWQEILRINLIGPFLAIKHAAPLLKSRGGGSIICTASVAGLRSGAGGPAYSASKAGVISLVRAGAQQLSGSNVRVNAICPGLIETGMTQMIYDHARERGREERARPSQPAAPGRRADRDRPGRLVPRLGRKQLRQRPCASGRWRPFFLPPLQSPRIWPHGQLTGELDEPDFDPPPR